MKSLSENSWITTDGFIWLQVFNQETVVDILLRNSFELYVVNISEEKESLLNSIPTSEAEEWIDKVMSGEYSDEIICIPVGQLEKIAPNIFRNNF